MKKILYENYLLVKHYQMTISQINSLEEYERNYYLEEIEKYIKSDE